MSLERLIVQFGPGRIKIEPGADGRLDAIRKKALNTPPKYKPAERPKLQRKKH